jgi:hypothetical protein
MNRDPITTERMENAMLFLSESDEQYAKAKADLLRAEILSKRTRARVFVETEGGVEVRKAKAEGHADVVAADESLCASMLEFETLKAKRSRAEILIDVYRTLEASRRKS